MTAALMGCVAGFSCAAAQTSYETAAAEAAGSETVIVEGARVAKEKQSTAAGLPLTLRETPQSVTVVSRQQIDAFNLDTANDLLAYVPGINVEKVETDRTYYNARGFDVTNFQVDGIGLPLIWGIQFGDLDTAIYDRVEAIRGADAITTPTGNPAATINYVRKRPGEKLVGSAEFELGSWDKHRFVGDVTLPLSDDGSLAARLVYANEDSGSYLDYYGINRNVFYGIVAWQASSDLTLTAGYSWQDNRADGVLWGALPLTYSDGTPIDYPRSASTSADWTYWNVKTQSAFGEVAYRLDGGWQLKGIVTYNRFDELAKLLYAFGYPDPATGEGVFGMSGIYPSTYEQWLFDVVASGPFTLFGREHELVVGANRSTSHGIEFENFAEDYPAFPPVGTWGDAQVAEPSYPGEYLAADQKDRLYRIYAATHLSLTDNLHVILGASYVSLTSKGFSYGVDTPRDEDNVSPYAGLVYDLTDEVSLYASYTDIFNPQSEVDIGHQRLAAARGESYEAGIKSEWLDGWLYATASVFRARQYGLAEWAGTFDDGKSYYAGVDTFVEGYEFEVAGRLIENWTVSGGWTQLWIEGSDGEDVRTYLPRRSLKLATTYTVPEWNDLTLGAALRWQSSVTLQDLVLIKQPSYAVLDLMAGVRVVDGLRATVNVRNATDEKYLTSLMWNQSYYAAPRSVSLTLSYGF